MTDTVLLNISVMYYMYNVKVENKKINYKKKFGSIWPRSVRGEDFFNISQSKTRIALGSHVCWPNETK